MPFRPHRAIAALSLCILSAHAQPVVGPRQTVTFQTVQTTTPGRSIFILGDLPELGGNDMRRAVKLEPSAYPTWRAAISLPAGRFYNYRFVLRDDAPGRTSDPTNGVFLGSASGATNFPSGPIPRKVVFAHLPISPESRGRAILHYRRGPRSELPANVFNTVTMQPIGQGRTPAEFRWMAWNFTAPGSVRGEEIEFFFTNAQGTQRTPASGAFTTFIDGPFVQDGQVFSYIPPASSAAPRRDYSTANPPSLQSIPANLNELRRYRVVLPRGYDQNPNRRYPVLYMHDGQNVFDQGSFGSWNALQALTDKQRDGHMREVIAVGVDNGPNRLSDYLPPDDTTFGPGRADRYARFVFNELKPIIDAQYRTLPDQDNTAVLGSSMGGVVSLYMGWDFSGVVSRVGLFSGAWWSTPNFVNRVRNAPARSIRIYMDSGDSGQSNDDYWNTYNLRDALVGGAAPRYPAEGTLRHTVGFGQQHNEAAWAARLPDALRFLFPAEDGVPDTFRTLFNPALDTNADQRIDAEDLIEQNRNPRDLNLDGAITDADTHLLDQFIQSR